MTRDNFPPSVAFVFKHEGGYVDHPRDPGGATNLGITHNTLSRWRDAVWTYVYEQLALVQAGQRTQPTIAEFIAELPAIVWPA